MAITTSSFTTNPVEFIRPYTPSGSEVTVWGCMDDRRPIQDCYVLGDRELYRQIPGGAHGVILDCVIAEYVTHPKSSEKVDELLIPELTKDFYETARERNLKAVMHEHCAAFLGAQSISEMIRNEIDKPSQLDSACEFYDTPTASPSDQLDDVVYEKVAIAHGKLAQSRLLLNPHEAAARLKANDSSKVRVPHAHLDGEHNATAFIANHVSGVAFDTRAAADAGVQAYHISLGDLEELVRTSEGIFRSIDPALVAASCAIRAAQIRNNHLLGPNGETLPIVQYA